MGTTRTAIDTGSCSLVFVAAIEGWSELFTNHNSTSAVATAWSGTGWSTVKGGLFVDLQVEQALSPDQPFVRGGTCTLTMMPQDTGANDIFGVAIGRKTSPAETYLDATLDNTSTTVTVKSTASFASSGYIHIGTECIAYTGKTSTTFTGCTRGAFAPFGSYGNQANGDTTKSFSHYHRVELDAQGVKLQPVVSSTQRTWAGRWVGVWAHRVVGGVLDVKAQAELIYSGQLEEWRDDENTGAVVLQLKPTQEAFAERLVGGSQWEGSATDGCYIATGLTFGWTDTYNGGTVKTANALTVVASGASGANQMNAGYWTLENLTAKISTWTAAEKTAGRLNGAYSISSPANAPEGGLTTKITWTLNPSAQLVGWGFIAHDTIMAFLGIEASGRDPTTNNPCLVVFDKPKANATWRGGTPNRITFETSAGTMARLKLTTRSGTITDQYATLPSLVQTAALGPTGPSGIVGSWGVFQVGNDRYFVAEITDNLDGTVELANCLGIFTQRLPFGFIWDPGAPITFGYDTNEQLIVRQVYVFEESPAVMALKLAVSTGEGGYNSPYNNTLPLGCGAGIPWELVDLLESSGAGIPGAAGTIAPIVDKPTTISALISSDFVFRWSFFHWRDGSLQLGSWQTPSVAAASGPSGGALVEANKGEPSGHVVNQKSSTAETTEWLRPVVKLYYNRISAAKGDDYRSNLTIEDRVTIDDMGGSAQAITINLRNTYQDFAGTGMSVEAARATFISNLTLVSRAARKISRSIDLRSFLSIGVGSVVLVTDTYARDPETGLRGITERPALVTRHQYNFGGAQAGSDSVSPMGGQVDLFFTDNNPDRLGAAYCPSADVLDTWNISGFSAGYSSGTLELACYEHRYSESTENQDVLGFADGDKVLIIERDPTDPANPLKWERTLAAAPSIGGIVNGLTLNSALTSPTWDATKKYHVLSQDYAAAASSQHANVYQANDATGLIATTTQPFLYGSGSADSTYTANTSTEIELLATSRYADGAARDVAHEAALCRLLDNIIDYKTALQSPMLCDEMSNTTISGTSYQLVAYWPITLSLELLSNQVFRSIVCAPWARSTDGTSTKIRVTLSRERPNFTSLTDPPWAGTFSQAEWTGITSTTATTLSDGGLTVNVKDTFSGHAWVAIECGYKCATRGLAKFIEGIRYSV